MQWSLIIFLIFFSNNLLSQTIKGIVTDEEGGALPFTNVYLTSLQDTTKIIAGTLTDLKGKYTITLQESGIFVITASFVGYITHKDTIVLKNRRITHNITLKRLAEKLKEIEISATTVKKEINKKTFYITEDMVANSISSLDMLKNISEVTVNPVTNTITTRKNGAVKILVNGIESNEQELLTIKPDDIIKIEYYDIVPARYLNTNIKAVINIITKKSLNGINGLIDAKAAVTTGFNDDLLNLNYVHNNTKVSLNYFFSVRDYKNRKVNENLVYGIGNIEYHKEKKGQPSPMGYVLHDINLKIINKKDSNYLFQFETKPFIVNGYKSVSQELNYTIGDSIIRGSTGYSVFDNMFQPKFDFYYEKELKKRKKSCFRSLLFIH